MRTRYPYWSSADAESYWLYHATIPTDAQVYAEPFGMADSPMMFRPVAPCEAVNDIAAHYDAVFRALMNERDALEHLYHATRHEQPLIDAVWKYASHQLPPPTNLEHARAILALYAQRAEQAHTRGAIHDSPNYWLRELYRIDRWQQRALHAQYDRRDPVDFMRYWDTPQTVFAVTCPPPSDSARLITICHQLRGRCVVLTEHADIWDAMLKHRWQRTDTKRYAIYRSPP